MSDFYAESAKLSNRSQVKSEVIPMYDELIKNLRETDFSDGCPCGAENLCKDNDCLIWQAADAIENLITALTASNEVIAKNKPKWIPVTERLPDVFKHVLVNIPGMAPHPTVQEGFREKNGMWYLNGFRYEADDITHWMPLPEPPKE